MYSARAYFEPYDTKQTLRNRLQPDRIYSISGEDVAYMGTAMVPRRLFGNKEMFVFRDGDGVDRMYKKSVVRRSIESSPQADNPRLTELDMLAELSGIAPGFEEPRFGRYLGCSVAGGFIPGEGSCNIRVYHFRGIFPLDAKGLVSRGIIPDIEKPEDAPR